VFGAPSQKFVRRIEGRQLNDIYKPGPYQRGMPDSGTYREQCGVCELYLDEEKDAFLWCDKCGNGKGSTGIMLRDCMRARPGPNSNGEGYDIDVNERGDLVCGDLSPSLFGMGHAKDIPPGPYRKTCRDCWVANSTNTWPTQAGEEILRCGLCQRYLGYGKAFENVGLPLSQINEGHDVRNWNGLLACERPRFIPRRQNDSVPELEKETEIMDPMQAAKEFEKKRNEFFDSITGEQIKQGK